MENGKSHSVPKRRRRLGLRGSRGRKGLGLGGSTNSMCFQIELSHLTTEHNNQLDRCEHVETNSNRFQLSK